MYSLCDSRYDSISREMTNYKGAFPTILHRKCSWLTVPHANFSLKSVHYLCMHTSKSHAIFRVQI